MPSDNPRFRFRLSSSDSACACLRLLANSSSKGPGLVNDALELSWSNNDCTYLGAFPA